VLAGGARSRIRRRPGRAAARLALQAALVAVSAGAAVIAGEVLATLT
jgi:hypothetical protein